VALFKKKLTEKDAAHLFVSTAFSQGGQAWPEILRGLRGLRIDNDALRQAENANSAPFMLGVAILALDLRALENLFPLDQAERLDDLTRQVLTELDPEGDLTKAVDGAKSDFGLWLEAGPAGLHQIGYSLSDLLGLGIPRNPIVGAVLAQNLISCCGKWKAIRDQYRLVP
jgi:hypothetical protein